MDTICPPILPEPTNNMHLRRTALCLLLFVVASAASTFSQTFHAVAPHHSRAATCLPQERDALLSFKRGITGDPAGRLDSWRLGEADCCRWRGVQCSNRTGHVVGLHLRNAHDSFYHAEDTALAGQISPSLLSLQHLERLDLSMNNLSGPAGRVPVFLGLLNNLRYLNLSYMPLSGRVPPQLGNLSKLHFLDLSYTDVIYCDQTCINFPWRPDLYSTDISWLSNLPLRFLDLGNVDLSKTVDWAYAVNMVPSLKVLRLHSCSLTSANQSLPHLNITDLVELSLSSNFEFSSHPVASCWFWNLTSLQYLELSDIYLYGRIPDALGGMKSLQVLDFSSNSRSLQIMMADMRNLCSLEVLDLSYNELNGSMIELLLPECSVPNLKELHLESNNFVGVLSNWIGRRWSSLLVLDLSVNQLSGPLPSEIGMLNNLLTLDLCNNRLTGPVPFEVGMLNKLTHLRLGRNNLNGVMTHEHLAGLKSLIEIDLSSNSIKIKLDQEWLPPFRLEYASFASCQMGPQFPAWLQSQAGILDLDISSASIFGGLPDWIWTTFSNIQRLDVSNNSINGTLPANLENMTSLESLFLNSNQITGQIPQLPIFLIQFDISENFLSEPLPSNFGTQNLQYLNLASNRFSGPIPKSICQLKILTALNLANNLFEGEIPSCFEPRMITKLILHNNRLSGKFPPVFKTYASLSILDMSWNMFSGSLPMWIGNFERLKVLQLSHNMFTERIPATITRLESLVQLNLADNKISGPLPQHLSNLTGMTGPSITFLTLEDMEAIRVPVNLSVIMKGQERYYIDEYDLVSIDLSLNQLTGEIPGDITSLNGIINLNLSWNYLSGNVPDKIGVMQSLESLDLSKNKLYGELPQSLSNLSYLSCLDLSYNNLTGRIPSGGQLDTLYLQNPSMYDGNIGLCGYSLHKNCSDKSEPRHGDHKRDERDSQLMSFPFALGVGYVVGLWFVFCVILFKKSWRVAYFRLYDKVHVFVVVTWARWVQKGSTT